MLEMKAKIRAARTQDDVWQLIMELSNLLGFDRVCTHFMPNFRTFEIEFSELVKVYNIPTTLLDAISRNPRKDDPIFIAAISATQTFKVSNLSSMHRMTKAQRTHYQEHLSPLGDGLIVPAFGPSGHCGYSCYFGNDEFIDEFTAEDILEWFTQASFLRICEIENRAERGGITLSPRESEILGLIASGKTNAEISRQLGISLHSVNTYLNRCFTKLNVNDRTSAVLAAQRRSLLVT